MTRKEFYHSKAWKDVSRAYMASRMYLCERCGGPASICHHRRHLDARTVEDPSVSLAWGNLEALCQACHNQEHFKGSLATAPGLHFDERGELVKNGL